MSAILKPDTKELILIWNNFQLQILVSIIPIIIINLLIAIIFFIFCSFLVLSIKNKLIDSKSLNRKKAKLNYFFIGFIPLIFVLTLQIIFNLLINLPQINNINNITNPDLLNLRDQLLFFSIFITNLFLMTALMIKTSFFCVLPTMVLIIPIQFLISIIRFELINEISIILRMIIFNIAFFTYLLFLKLFFKNKILKTTIFTIFYALLLFLITIITNLIFNSKISFVFEWFFIIATSTAFFFICYAIIDNIDIEISKAKILKENISFDKFGFVRNAYAEEYFKNWVVENKISQGYMFLFKLNNENFINKKLGSKNLHKIINKIIFKLISKMKKNYLCFRGLNGEFYFFSKENNFKKVFFEINNLKSFLPKKILFNKENIFLYFNFYGAKYGIDANNFSDLTTCLNEASLNKGVNTSNFLIMYKFNEKLVNLKEWQNFEFLKSKIKIETLKVELIQKNFIWNILININYKKINNINDLIENIKDSNTKKLLIRYIAYHALKLFSYETGIINLPYMSEIIENKDFDLNFFLKTINMLGIKYNSINLKLIDKKINPNNSIYNEIKKIGINI